MVKKNYIPGRGDLIWVNFSPQKGHEQAGRRPALVLSPKKFNVATGLALCCPLTSQEKGRAFEVLVRTEKMRGSVLTDQARSFDWRARKVEFSGKAPEAVVKTVGILVAKIAQGE